MSSEFRFKNRIKAFIWMIIGSFVVFGSIVIMNQGEELERQEVKKTATFDIQKQEKKEEKPKQQPKQQLKPQSSTPRPPSPTIGSSISGLDLGIAGFDIEGMGEIGDDLLGDMSNVVMTEDSVDNPPKPRERTVLEYPKEARAKSITGYVTMNLLISTQGSVEVVKLLESSPQGVFEEAASTTVKGWKFDPALYQGKPVKVWAKQKIRFDLN